MQGLQINHSPLRLNEQRNLIFFGDPSAQPNREHRLANYLPYKVGTSHPGKFSPAYARFFRKVVNKSKAHYLYFKPDSTTLYQENRRNNYTSMNSYSDIYHNLENYTNSLGLYKFTVAGTDHYLIIGHQLIMDVKGSILFMGVSKGYQNTLNTENFKAYVASEFFNDEIYKYVIKKIDAEYLELFRKEGVEIVIKPALVIENEFFGPRMVQKFDNLEDFDVFKESIRTQLMNSIRATSMNMVAESIIEIAAYDDMQFPCPIPYGYTMKNLVGTMIPSHASPWNHGWDKKLLYFLMESEIWYNSLSSWMSLDSFLKTIHESYNPDTWITLDVNSEISEIIPEYRSLKYSPATQTIQLFACSAGMNIKLKISHRDEHILLKEEFGPVENVTFAIEPPLTQDDEVPFDDEVDTIRFDGITHTDPETGEVYHRDSQGVRWTIRNGATAHRRVQASDLVDQYVAGIDPISEGSSSRILGRGIMQQITDSGNTFVATQNYNVTASDVVESITGDAYVHQYPLRPSEAFLRDEENSVVGQQERPEGDETGRPMVFYEESGPFPDFGNAVREELDGTEDDEWEDADGDEDTGERPVASNEDTPIEGLPSWADDSNFTNNS